MSLWDQLEAVRPLLEVQRACFSCEYCNNALLDCEYPMPHFVDYNGCSTRIDEHWRNCPVWRVKSNLAEIPAWMLDKDLLTEEMESRLIDGLAHGNLQDRDICEEYVQIGLSRLPIGHCCRPDSIIQDGYYNNHIYSSFENMRRCEALKMLTEEEYREMTSRIIDQSFKMQAKNLKRLAGQSPYNPTEDL